MPHRTEALVLEVHGAGAHAACRVVKGRLHAKSRVSLVRRGKVIHKGRPLSKLLRFKEPAEEVEAGRECGVMISGIIFEMGDVLTSASA